MAIPDCLGVSEFLCNLTIGKFILPKRDDGKDMIPLAREMRHFWLEFNTM